MFLQMEMGVTMMVKLIYNSLIVESQNNRSSESETEKISVKKNNENESDCCCDSVDDMCQWK